jgi:membrane glycosyltransferase
MMMSAKRKNKINRIRTFALSLVFIGIIVMYGGIYFKSYPVIMVTLMLLGFLAVISSSVVYFWIGMISTKSVKVICPNCDQPTKVLGRVDACMNCNEPLTLDKSLEGKPFDEKYNKKTQLVNEKS